MTAMTIEQRTQMLMQIADKAVASGASPVTAEFLRDTATTMMLLQVELDRLASTLTAIAEAPGLAGIGLGTTFIGSQVQRWAAEAIATPGQPPQGRIILPNG